MKKLLLALLAIPSFVQACQLDPHQGEYTNSVYNTDAAEEKVVSNGVEYKGEELQPLVFVNESPKAEEPKLAIEAIELDIVQPKAETVKAPAEVKTEAKSAPVDTLVIEEIVLPKAENKDLVKTADAAVPATKAVEKSAEEKLLEEIKLELEKLDAADADKVASIFDEEIEVAPAK